MNSEGGREVNLVVIGRANCVSSGGQVAVEDVFGGGDEVLSGYGCATRDYSGRTANAFVEEGRCASRQGEGGA